MNVRVEFLGLARHHAGVESIEVTAATLGDLFRQLPKQLPATAAILPAGELASTYIASINGHGFTRDGNSVLKDGDTVLIFSADAGG